MKWEQWQVDYLTENYGEMTNQEIAAFVDRSESAVAVKAYNMGLKNTYVYLHKIRSKQQDTTALHKMFEEWDRNNKIPPKRRIPKSLSHLIT